MSLWNFSLGKNDGPELADFFDGGPKDSKYLISYRRLTARFQDVENELKVHGYDGMIGPRTWRSR